MTVSLCAACRAPIHSARFCPFCGTQTASAPRAKRRKAPQLKRPDPPKPPEPLKPQPAPPVPPPAPPAPRAPRSKLVGAPYLLAGAVLIVLILLLTHRPAGLVVSQTPGLDVRLNGQAAPSGSHKLAPGRIVVEAVASASDLLPEGRL